MNEARSKVLIAVEFLPQVAEDRLLLLNSLSSFVPNAYPGRDRPAFIFQPHLYGGTGRTELLSDAVIDSMQHAANARSKHEADICVYSSINGKRGIPFGIVTAVNRIGPLSIQLIGPFMEVITSEESDELRMGTTKYLKGLPDSGDNKDVDVAGIAGAVQWTLDSILDTTSTRH